MPVQQEKYHNPFTYQDGCVFCDRLRAVEYDSEDSGADGWTVANFEPLNPVTPGHRLFVPHAHVVNARVNPVITAATFQVATWWVIHHLGPEQDYNLITSVGSAATQTVRHLHVHLVPRNEGDGLHLPWTGQKRDD